MKYQKINLLLVQYKVFIYMLLLLSYSTYSMKEKGAQANIQRVMQKNTEGEQLKLMVEQNKQKKFGKKGGGGLITTEGSLNDSGHQILTIFVIICLN